MIEDDKKLTIEISADHLAEIFIFLQALNALLHNKRELKDFRKFQKDHYRKLHEIYYKTFSAYLSDEFFDRWSEVDLDNTHWEHPGTPPYDEELVAFKELLRSFLKEGKL